MINLRIIFAAEKPGEDTFFAFVFYVKLKVKQSRYSPGVAERVPGS